MVSLRKLFAEFSMVDEKFKMQNFIEISSSEESESESSASESDEDSVERSSSSTSCDDDNEDDAAAGEWIDSEDGEDDDSDFDKDEDYADKDDVESLGNKVIQIIRGRNDIHELSLVECKAYRRRHGLRLSGTKEDCIERIKEHLRLALSVIHVVFGDDEDDAEGLVQFPLNFSKTWMNVRSARNDPDIVLTGPFVLSS